MKILDTIKASIDTELVDVSGKVLPVSECTMGNNQSFKINPSGEGRFDRDVQKKMLSQGPMQKWGVFFCRQDQQVLDVFMREFQQAMNNRNFDLNCGRPASFPIGSQRWEDWDGELRSKFQPDVSLIVCIIPGSKNKSPLYDQLKQLTFKDFPVPTQMVLVSTLRKERGVRSVINKILIQMNAKVGGIPWGMRGIPLQGTGNMVVGIVFYGKGKPNSSSYIGFVATKDQEMLTYYSYPYIYDSSNKSSVLVQAFEDAVTEFKKANNGQGPRSVLVYREGIAESAEQELLTSEVQPIAGAIKHGTPEGIA